MAPTEPRPFWSWSIKGLGGILTMFEMYLKEGLIPETHQVQLFEYQLSRMRKVFDAIAEEGAEPRGIDEIDKTRWFAPSDVLHFPEQQRMPQYDGEHERKRNAVSVSPTEQSPS